MQIAGRRAHHKLSQLYLFVPSCASALRTVHLIRRGSRPPSGGRRRGPRGAAGAAGLPRVQAPPPALHSTSTASPCSVRRGLGLDPRRYTTIHYPKQHSIAWKHAWLRLQQGRQRPGSSGRTRPVGGQQEGLQARAHGGCVRRQGLQQALQGHHLPPAQAGHASAARRWQPPQHEPGPSTQVTPGA